MFCLFQACVTRSSEDEAMTVNIEARDVPVAGPTRDALARNRFDRILETIGRTPVVRVKKLAPAHVALYVKIEARARDPWRL